MRVSVLLIALGLLLVPVMAPVEALAVEPLRFTSDEQEQRFKDLILELRCAVCQNQSLADSDAPLAHDLRQEIHDMMMDGQSDEQIRGFLVDRYGDFVLYRPAIGGNTLLLWLAPGLLLLGGGAVVAYSVRRHRLVDKAGDFDPEARNEDLSS